MEAPRISGSLTLHHKISGSIQIQPTPSIEPYAGEYEYTPSEDTQTILIERKLAKEAT